jgi:hypothetical protein
MKLVEHKVHLELGHNLTLVVDVTYDMECMPRMTRVEIVEDAVRQAHDNGIRVDKGDYIRTEAVL